jgi:hypothetical protein
MNIEKILMIVLVLGVLIGTFLYAWTVVKHTPLVAKACADHGGKIMRDKCAIPKDGVYILYNIDYDYDNKEYILTR